jgi:hypothetical protein
MQRIFHLLNKITQSFIKKLDKVEKPLGRWNIEYCSNKLDKKIDMSNEDHCGPCGQYVIDKSNSSNISLVKYIEK